MKEKRLIHQNQQDGSGLPVGGTPETPGGGSTQQAQKLEKAGTLAPEAAQVSGYLDAITTGLRETVEKIGDAAKSLLEFGNEGNKVVFTDEKRRSMRRALRKFSSKMYPKMVAVALKKPDPEKEKELAGRVLRNFARKFIKNFEEAQELMIAKQQATQPTAAPEAVASTPAPTPEAVVASAETPAPTVPPTEQPPTGTV